MKFRTEYSAVKAPFLLHPEKPVVLMGSCFSQNMAEKMNQHGWNAINPGGTLYNPASIATVINLFTDRDSGKERFENSLFEYSDIFNSKFFDSSFSSLNKKDSVSEFILRRDQFLQTLEKGKTLIITFGTSIVYYLSTDNVIVGNCHKQPSSLFYNSRLTIDEIKNTWDNLISRLQNLFPGLKIIFTVSPVRHLKNGFEGNARSKAILLLAVDEICRANKECHYFPAYEILNDDLRDYRFYAEDLVHPSSEGIDYIWGKFRETYLDSEGEKILEKGLKEFKSAHHRPKTGALGKFLK